MPWSFKRLYWCKFGIIDEGNSAGDGEDDDNVEGKAQAEVVRMWIRSVLRKIIQYKAEHRCYLNDTATTLKLPLPNDTVFKNALPFP